MTRPTLREFSPAQAWSNFSATDNNARFGGIKDRTRRGIFLPELSSGHSIAADEAIYCMGSCFAKNIERFLSDTGLNVLSRNIQALGEQPYLTRLPNLFTPFSILNEIRWALDPASPFPDAAIIEDDAGYCHDPHTDASMLSVARETAYARRRSITATMAQIASCRTVVVTLGLIEAWYDRELDLYLNTTLPYYVVAQDPERYVFRVLDHRACFEALEEIHGLLTRFGHADAQLVVSVSPIPLKATFSGEDIAVANTLSKATLRVAAADFCGSHDNVHYLPSFESVMTSDRATTWHDDGRHVTDTIVRANILRFVQAFMADPSVSKRAAEALEELVGGDSSQPQAARRACSPVPDFWRAMPGDASFPGGFPRVTATTALAPEFDAGGLMSATRRIWHASSPPRYPQLVTAEFDEPVAYAALWMQSQACDRAPTDFTLEGSNDGTHYATLLRVEGACWQGAMQWQCWRLPVEGAYKTLRLAVGKNGGCSRYLTIRKLWLQPAAAVSDTVPECYNPVRAAH